MNPVKTLAEYVTNARYDNLPKEVAEQAKYVILDTIGCALGGAKTDLGRVVSETIRDLGAILKRR